MSKILIINGPNLNLLGVREPELYGNTSFEEFLPRMAAHFAPHGMEFDYFQSNVEGELINRLQAAVGGYDGVILNAGGYTHTSVALADCVAAVAGMGLEVVEVHISNVLAREPFRHVSLIGGHCAGTISGFGMHSYCLAAEYFKIKYDNR